MNNLLKKLINDPNISPAFASAVQDEEKKTYCYCGGVMQPIYDYARNTIILRCSNCGKERKLQVNNLERGDINDN